MKKVVLRLWIIPFFLFFAYPQVDKLKVEGFIHLNCYLYARLNE